MARSMLLSLSLAAILAAPAAAQDAVTLAYKTDEGSESSYKVRFSAKATGMMPLEGKGEIYLTHVGAGTAEGLGQTTQDITRVKAEMTLLGQDNAHDTASGEKPDGTNMVANAAEALLGKTKLKLKPTGEVTESKAEGKGSGNSPLRTFIGAQFLPFDLLRLPEAPVKIGDTWTHVVTREDKDAMTGAVTTVKMTYTYTLKRVLDREDGQLATIDIVSDPGLKTMPGSMGAAKVTKQRGTGTATFNITEGRLRSLTYKLQVQAENEFAEGDDKLSSFKQSLSIRRDGDEEDED